MPAWRPILFYFMGKALRYTVSLWIILSINFFVPRIMPGDPMVNLLGEDAVRIDKEILDGLRAQYKLDGPLLDQYGAYLRSICRLDFGYSIHKNTGVASLLMYRLCWTLLLVLPFIVIGGTSALLLGIICGFKPGSGLDRSLTSAAMLLYTLPAFLFAMLMVSIFSFHLGWFPLGGISSGGDRGLPYWIDIAWHMCLPVLILSILEAAYGLIIIRSAVISVVEEYFILVAHAKGLSRRAIAFRHVMRNVLPQFISMMALNFGFMVSGALVIEIVFSLNGMGALIYDAVMSRDYPVMQGAFVVITLSMLGANFLADLLYGIVDPRTAEGARSHMGA